MPARITCASWRQPRFSPSRGGGAGATHFAGEFDDLIEQFSAYLNAIGNNLGWMTGAILGGIGLVLLINNANPDPLADLQGYLHAFKDFISKTAVTIGVTHMDRAEAPDLDAYRTRLASLGHQPPPAVFRVDARSRDDVAMLVKALLYTLNPGLIDA